MSDVTVIGAVVAFIGLGFLYFCARFFLARSRMRREGVVVDGEVVGEERSTATTYGGDAFSSTSTRRTRTYSHPVVAFHLADGRPWQASTQVNASSPITRGTTVRIRYLPGDPSKVWLADDSSPGMVMKIFAAAGAVMIIAGAATAYAGLA